MPDKRYLEFKCRNKPYHGSDFECHHKIGGPSVSSIMRHNFDEGPYEDVRYCPKCGWIQLVIDSIHSVPRLTILGKGKGVCVPMVAPERVFGFTETVGIRVCRTQAS